MALNPGTFNPSGCCVEAALAVSAGARCFDVSFDFAQSTMPK